MRSEIERNCKDFRTRFTTIPGNLSVLPYAPVRGANRVLLKMHGCITAPDDLVITEGDY